MQLFVAITKCGLVVATVAVVVYNVVVVVADTFIVTGFVVAAALFVSVIILQLLFMYAAVYVRCCFRYMEYFVA